MTLKSKSIPFLAAGLCMLAIVTFGLIAGKASVAPAIPTAGIERNQVPASSVDAIPMLPIVNVTAQAPLPVLPRVIVRASAAERAAADQLDSDGDSLIVAKSAGSSGDGDLPHVHLDMPYYSFGKVLPRISKE